MMNHPIISITTDFGQLNGFVGVMKGVIWGIAPQAQIADITHDIPPQNVRLGAYALWRAVPFFPPGSIHIAVVDPGVGTHRRPIGAQLGSQRFILPDNGLITPMLEDAEKAGQLIEIVHLNNPAYWLPDVSHTFHGRDIFAPTGAHLAAGVPLQDLGDPVTDPVRLEFSRPVKTAQGWTAHITIIDVFGNLTMDLPAKAIKDAEGITFSIRDHVIDGLVTSYGHRETGELIALVDSENYIEISVVNGNAARQLGAQIGDPVEVILHA
jgi:S-adenosyl-L-methionine hydrolase (adenosine-forming)